MDLYIQIGVLLLFLAALALFIFVFTQPAQQFTQKINQENQKIQDRLATVEGMDLAPFMNNTNAPGTSIYPMIRDANAGKLAILIQTKNQQGLIVNYGTQLRPANTSSVLMKAPGTSGVGNVNGTDFEKNFVTYADAVFNQATGAQTVNNSGNTFISSFTPKADPSNISKLLGVGPDYPQGSLLKTEAIDVPRLMFADPTVSAEVAAENGRTFGSTGFMYTDQVIKKDMPINNNFSYADNQGSLYRFDQNASYYTTIILDANGEPVGIYVEEHGINPKSAALGQAMYANGTITALY